MMDTAVFFNVSLIFTTYGYFGPVKCLFFFLIFVVYFFSVFSNVFLMVLIYTEPSLHKPMYIFLFNLAINGLIGSSVIWPKIMENLMAETQVSSYQGCMMQAFIISIYGACTYTVLTCMAYDRYVSICKPLQYHTIMTPGKVRNLLMVAYILPLASVSVLIGLTSLLPLCRYTIHKVFCDNLTVVNLSCIKSNLVNIYGICIIVILVVLPMLLVVISYVKILMVSLKTSKESQKKALSTCTPHLITFINFSLASLFSVIYNRLFLDLPKEINIFMALHVFLIPPLLHPVIYGIRTQEIRKCITKIVKRRRVFAGLLTIAHVNAIPQLAPVNVC